MDAKYNVGEPVAVYGWVKRIETTIEGVTYDIEVRDINGKPQGTIYGVTDEELTTVF